MEGLDACDLRVRARLPNTAFDRRCRKTRLARSKRAQALKAADEARAVTSLSGKLRIHVGSNPKGETAESNEVYREDATNL